MTEATPRKVITRYVYPPIPDRRFDWCAHYDGDEEGPTGWGRTEEEAIEDLASNSDVSTD